MHEGDEKKNRNIQDDVIFLAELNPNNRNYSNVSIKTSTAAQHSILQFRNN